MLWMCNMCIMCIIKVKHEEKRPLEVRIKTTGSQLYLKKKKKKKKKV